MESWPSIFSRNRDELSCVQGSNGNGRLAGGVRIVPAGFQGHPRGNRLFDTSVTARRYLAGEIVDHAEIVKDSPDEGTVRLTGTRPGFAWSRRSL